MNPVLRDTSARVAAAVGLTEAARWHRGRLLVITFHRVLPAHLRARYPFPGLAVTPEELDWVLRTLARDYTLLPLAEAHVRHARGERPRRPFLAVTFDDGERDNRAYAEPVLSRHGVRATFFVPVEAVDRGTALWHDRLGFAALALASGHGDAATRRRVEALGLSPATTGFCGALTELAKALFPAAREALVRALEEGTGAEVPAWAAPMGWDDVRALASRGHEIGSHSVTHPILPQCDDATLLREVEGSRARLEEALSAPVVSFCYPNGDHDARVVAALARAGYARAVTTTYRANALGAPAYALGRFDVDARRLRDRHGALSAALLRLRLACSSPKLVGRPRA